MVKFQKLIEVKIIFNHFDFNRFDFWSWSLQHYILLKKAF